MKLDLNNVAADATGHSQGMSERKRKTDHLSAADDS